MAVETSWENNIFEEEKEILKWSFYALFLLSNYWPNRIYSIFISFFHHTHVIFVWKLCIFVYTLSIFTKFSDLPTQLLFKEICIETL